jgi:hypothetical protein
MQRINNTGHLKKRKLSEEEFNGIASQRENTDKKIPKEI